MDTNLLNNYVLKAIDAYPYELEETVENLNYALSYEAHNAYALYLMGCLHAEHIGDYEKAKHYFAEALASKMDFQKVYYPYILVLIWNDDYEEAQKLIDFAITVKGIDRGTIWFFQGVLYEYEQHHKKAIKAHKKAKRFGYNDGFINQVNSEISRIKKKINPKKKTSKRKKKKKNKK
ncbi:tetratricopeptide repeat protein [Sediminibacter sp. Hel_I_10]|uniref:tetratricopeptide repeat protein n=1 Tax=Sediminibacter sp. Hel_I_10 TaxID=1392490 RepID=UPI00047AA5F3|nr:tetratricopeptide repeat protein [Sediminibacter sp. Hel_I_10]